MSGYGGRPPSEWQGPYGQSPYEHNPYDQSPYGQGPYGQNAYEQSSHGRPPDEGNRGWASPGQGGGAYGGSAQDAYGAYNAYGTYGTYGTYGANGGGYGAYGGPAAYGGADPYGYGPPGFPRMPPASNAAAVAAIIGNCVGLVFVCGIGIAWLPGLILGGVAVNKVRSDPAAARNLTRGSWICCGLNFVIEAVIFLVWYVSTH